MAFGISQMKSNSDWGEVVGDDGKTDETSSSNATETVGKRMNRNVVSRRQVAGVLLIAALISSVITLVGGTRAPPFYLEISMRSSDSGNVQFYYQIGRGINAADSTSARLPDGESTVRLPLPAGDYRAIRFDPIDHGYCHVTIRQIRIIDVSGRVVRSFFPEEFAEFHDVSERRIANGEIDLYLNARESDPSLGLVLPVPLRLSPSAVPFCLFILKAFLLCFIPAGAVGIIWLLFARRGWAWHSLLLCGLGAFLYLGARSRFFAPINFDEGDFIWYGSLLNAGGVPYRDLFEPKGPVIFFANALGLSLFGLKGFLFRIVPTTVALTSIAVFYVAMIKRRNVPWLAALLTAQVALWLFSADFHDTGLNDSETYGFAFAILGFSLGLVGSALRSRFANTIVLVLSGIFLGLSVLSKELFVFSVIPAWVFLGIRRDRDGWDWRPLLLSAAGGLFVGFSFLSYLGAHSALGSYLDLLRFSRALAANYCVDIGAFPNVTGLSVIPPAWKKLHAYLYNFNHLAFVLALCVLIVPIRRALKHRPRFVELAIGMSAVVLGIVAVSTGYCFWRHYFLMGTTGLLLFGVIGAEALNAYLREKGPRIKQASCVALMAVFLFVAWTPTRVMLTDARGNHGIARWEPLVAETIERHSKRGDYILAPGVAVIFVALDRKNPYPLGGPPDELLPYLPVANPKLQIESLREQLEQNLPKVCYFAESFRPKQKRWHELLYDPLLAKHQYIKVNDRLWYLPEGK